MLMPAWFGRWMRLSPRHDGKWQIIGLLIGMAWLATPRHSAWKCYRADASHLSSLTDVHLSFKAVFPKLGHVFCLSWNSKGSLSSPVSRSSWWCGYIWYQGVLQFHGQQTTPDWAKYGHFGNLASSPRKLIVLLIILWCSENLLRWVLPIVGFLRRTAGSGILFTTYI